jgi:hypothetical protein
MTEQSKAIEEAERAGFDLSLVDENLALSPAERTRRHDQALALVLEFDRIRLEREAIFSTYCNGLVELASILSSSAALRASGRGRVFIPKAPPF